MYKVKLEITLRNGQKFLCIHNTNSNTLAGISQEILGESRDVNDLNWFCFETPNNLGINILANEVVAIEYRGNAENL